MCHAKTRRIQNSILLFLLSSSFASFAASREIISFRWARGSSHALADDCVTLVVRKGDAEQSYLESKIGGLSDMGSVESVMGLKIPPAPNQS